MKTAPHDSVKTVADTEGRRGVARPDATSAVLVRAPTAEDADPVRYRRRRRRVDLALAWLTPVVFFGLWQLTSSQGWIDPDYFPPPSEVWSAGVTMIEDGVWAHNVWVSLKLVLYGFALGVATGALVGLAMGVSRTLRAAFDPLLTAFYMVPKLALLPLLLLIFGIGDFPRILQIAITVFFFMWLSTMAAFMTVPEGYREAARSFGTTNWQQFRHVLLPAALPSIFVALRLSIGVAVLMMVAVEFVQASEGIGWMIWHSWSLLKADDMYVGIVTVSVMGVALTTLLRAIGRIVMPWTKATGGDSSTLPF